MVIVKPLQKIAKKKGMFGHAAWSAFALVTGPAGLPSSSEDGREPSGGVTIRRPGGKVVEKRREGEGELGGRLPSSSPPIWRQRGREEEGGRGWWVGIWRLRREEGRERLACLTTSCQLRV